MMSTGSLVPLAIGLWHDGWHTEAMLRPLTGADEAASCGPSADVLPAMRKTALLAATVERIGSLYPVEADVIRLLTVGDRELLVLWLYMATFHQSADLVAKCSAPGCGQLMELSLSLPDLLDCLPPVDRRPDYEITVMTVAGQWRVRFRLPTGADEEAAARLAPRDLTRAADLLLSRCILDIVDETGRPLAAEGTLPDLRIPLADAFHTLDPAAEWVTALTCPTCGHVTNAALNGLTLLDGELSRFGGIIAEVHRLTCAYRWNLSEVLALPVARRRQFLALIDETRAVS